MRLAYDIEGDPIPTTKVHCLCVKDVDKNEKVLRFQDSLLFTRDGTLEEGLELLASADLIIAHNHIGYDGPTLARLKSFAHKNFIDTLVLSHLIFPWIGVTDKARLKKGFPKELIGWHSLKAWGYRLGDNKQDAPDPEENPEWWSKLSEEMLDYCAQDTTLLARLFLYFEKQKWPQQSTDLEHSFAECIHRQMENGVGFNQEAAQELVSGWQERRAVLVKELGSHLGSWTKRWTTPKKQLKREKVIQYDPSSRYQVANALRDKFKWKPQEWTPSGLPKLDEKAITLMDRATIPFKDLLLEWFTISHRLGQAAEGEQAWLNHSKETEHGVRIFGRVNHNGARTGRCTHSRPNMNVPRVGALFGEECRALFQPRPGWRMVGADLSGIEARILAHYLAPYDGGKYVERVLAGNVHTDNQMLLGFSSRLTAKSCLYATMYGAQGKKLGAVISAFEDRPSSEAEGVRAQKLLFESMPGFQALVDDVYAACKENGFLRGLDGRRLKPRKRSATLNCLFQSGGALVMKWTTVIQHQLLDMIVSPDLWAPMLHVHDEAQAECHPSVTEQVERITLKAMRLAGEKLKLNIPIEGEAKTGANWAMTH